MRCTTTRFNEKTRARSNKASNLFGNCTWKFIIGRIWETLKKENLNIDETEKYANFAAKREFGC